MHSETHSGGSLRRHRPSGLHFDSPAWPSHRPARHRFRTERELASLPAGTLKDIGYPSAGGSDVHANPVAKRCEP